MEPTHQPSPTAEAPTTSGSAASLDTSAAPDAFAAPAAPAIISVRGEALVTVEPELADLTIVVTTQAKDRRDAFDRLAKRNEEVLELLRSYGEAVEKVESSAVGVHPDLRKGGREEKIRSYRGVVRIAVAVADFSVLGEIVARVADLEAAHLEGPNWRLRRDSPVYRRARTQAVREALTRARDYAEALGSCVSGLIELADNGLMQNQVARPVHAAFARSAAPAPAGGVAYGAAGPGEPPALDLEPAEQEVRASVEARFSATQPRFGNATEG